MSETQTTHKPLSCPFCGGEKIAIAEGSTYRWAHAECGECGAAAGDIRRQYGQGTDTPEVQEAAIAEWNTRDRREIDGLLDELAVILRERNDAHLALAERTRERDEARRHERMAVDGRGRENVARITHEVWSMWMRELGKNVQLPNAELRRLQTPYHNLSADDQATCLAIADDYIRAIGTPLVKIANELRQERDESRAEADRLRPAAEAWEADQYYGNLLWSLPIERDTAQEEKLQRAATRRRETNDAAHAAARQSDARARAAKGAK